jgi:hypothetical protein
MSAPSSGQFTTPRRRAFVGIFHQKQSARQTLPCSIRAEKLADRSTMTTRLQQCRWLCSFLVLVQLIGFCYARTSEGAKSWTIETQAWKLWTSQRWSDDFNQKSLSPFLIVPARHSGQVYNILMPKTASEEWEFYYARKETGVADPSTAVSGRTLRTGMESKLDQTKKHAKMSNILRKSLRRFVDDYNFKGYGISIYKSFIYPKSAGLAFRVPIFGNWNWWDSIPALPSINSMVRIDYPLKLSFCLTFSIHIEAVKWAFLRVLAQLRDAIYRIFYEFVRSQYLLVSILLYPFHGKWLEPPLSPPSQTMVPKPLYKADIQERLGMTAWWSWSLARGFYRRVSYWHMYLPTLRVYQELLRGTINVHPWLEKHAACFGLDTACPNPIPPHVFFTGVLSLSGLFLQKSKPISQEATNELTTLEKRSLVQLMSPELLPNAVLD